MSIFPTEEEKMDGLRTEIDRLTARIDCNDKLIQFINENAIILSKEVIFVEDPKEGVFTVFFKEIPNVISEGETKEEAYHNLILTLHDIVESHINKK